MGAIVWILIAIGALVAMVMGWRRFAEHIHDKDTDLWARPKYDNREMYEE